MNKNIQRALFGEEKTQTEAPKKSNYADFVEKFKPKKTTDDCYTPPAIYEAVLEYVGTKYDLTGKQVARPFYPNGDFQNFDYSDNVVVIDNPPFSIITKIAKFYTARNIPFFLFAPHLTLFSSDINCTCIVCGVSIVYENGAIVNTSFLSNLFGDARVLACPQLYGRINEIQKINKANLPKYTYPENVLTVSQLDRIIGQGIELEIKKESTQHCRALKSQRKVGKAMFGSGFLISEKAAAEKAAAEKAAAEKAAAEKAAAEKAAAENRVIWELSEEEKKIIASLL